MKRIAILDYGVGNVRSLTNALNTLQCEAVLSNDTDTVLASDKLIIPGVGAFAYCMEQVQVLNLQQLIYRFADSGKPLLGICVGMQLLFSESEEHQLTVGLNLIPGRVKKLPVQVNEEVRLPHIGWNQVTFVADADTGAPYAGFPDKDNFYFVHSFACCPAAREHVLANSHYAGIEFVSAAARDNVVGVQFHPERSGNAGLRFLDNFVSA